VALGIGGTVVARARAVIEADTRGFDKGVDASEKRLRRWNRVATKAALGVAVAFGVGAKRSIDAAKDLNEEVNKSSVVFGKASADVLAWSTKSANAFGSSRRAALQYAGVFGNMLRPMGFTEKAAAGMSKRLVELSGDMASFNNASPEEVLLALRAGLAGETEPLRRFGVFLNQARVEAEAMTSGLVKSTVDLTKVKAAQLAVAEATAKHTQAVKEHGPTSQEAQKAALALEIAEGKLQKAIAGKAPKLTAAQKAQASYNVILKDTVLQQGDFARTADSAANRERILAAQTEDLSAQLGTALLPAYQAVLSIGLKVVGFMSEHSRETKVAIGVVGGLAAAILVLNGALKAYRAVMAAVNVIMALNPFVAIAAAVVALGVALVVAYKKSETFRDVVNGVFSAVRSVVAEAVGAIVWYLDKWLGGLSSLAGAASKLPFVGDKFKGVGNAIDEAREKMRGLEDMIRGSSKRKVALTATVTTERFDRPSSTALTTAGVEAKAKRKGNRSTSDPVRVDPAAAAALAAAQRPGAVVTTKTSPSGTPTKVEVVKDTSERAKAEKKRAETEAKAFEATTRRQRESAAKSAHLARWGWGAAATIAKKGPMRNTRPEARNELTAQMLAAREYDFLAQRKSFVSQYASNMFEPGTASVGGQSAAGGPTVIVNQTFPAPTTDKHREAAYARRAMKTVFAEA
jgi:hypothetical protein